MITSIMICSEKEDAIEAMVNVATNQKMSIEAHAGWVILAGYALKKKGPSVCVSDLLPSRGEQVSLAAFKELEDLGLVYSCQSADGETLYISDEPKSGKEFRGFVGDSLNWTVQSTLEKGRN